ncbi:MAG: hypothetical protein HY744_31700, partial [Deltaproteobacteria bacterium]|nr:hypothetical protein [Deltaproteobacteria bacterium]
ALVCVGGTTKCAGKCVDTQLDPANCGGCGKACGKEELCSAGQCDLQCVGGTTKCSGKCVDTLTDTANCGGCGKLCAKDQICTGGACALVCVGGTTKCAGKCVDTQLDPANCGGCGNACGPGWVCTAGVCGLVCGGGTTKCSGKCVDTQLDPANCGSCSNACAQGEVCANGKCELYCGGGLTKCSGKCVDTLTNPLHCGGCDKACGGGAKCANGACAPLKSCLEILNAGLSKGDGAYAIDPNGGDPSDAFVAYCDMAGDGGGWTLVMKQAKDSGYGSDLAVNKWAGWSQPNQVMNPKDATLNDGHMINLAYSTLVAAKLRLTASQTWVSIAKGGWERTVNSTAYDALSDANANKYGNLGGANNTPWPPASFTDNNWTQTSTGYQLCWRAGPWFNQTSFEYTQGGIKWGWFFNNECGQSSTDTAEGLGCCGNPDWFRKSPWTLYVWAR